MLLARQRGDFAFDLDYLTPAERHGEIIQIAHFPLALSRARPVHSRVRVEQRIISVKKFPELRSRSIFFGSLIRACGKMYGREEIDVSRGAAHTHARARAAGLTNSLNHEKVP